jgi:hypothetical protein
MLCTRCMKRNIPRVPLLLSKYTYTLMIESSMQQWRSPLLSCVVSDGSLQNKKAAAADDCDDDAVGIPVSGWYALCFGYEESDCCPVESLISYRLVIKPHEDSAVSVCLPLGHGSVIYDVNIGKLIYLIEGCSLRLSSTVDTKHDAPAAVPSKEGKYAPMWCVIYQRSEPKDTAEPTPTLGAISTSNKPLVCRYCVRTFPNIRAVHCHTVAVHVRRPACYLLRFMKCRWKSSTRTCTLL